MKDNRKEAIKWVKLKIKQSTTVMLDQRALLRHVEADIKNLNCVLDLLGGE